MNPVSRKHNDALFTIAPVNVNAVILVFLGLIPFWSYHKIKTFYYLRQLNKINPSKKKICLSKGIQCCKDPKRCMSGTLSQPETMLDVSYCFMFGCMYEVSLKMAQNSCDRDRVTWLDMRSNFKMAQFENGLSNIWAILKFERIWSHVTLSL